MYRYITYHNNKILTSSIYEPAWLTVFDEITKFVNDKMGTVRGFLLQIFTIFIFNKVSNVRDTERSRAILFVSAAVISLIYSRLLCYRRIGCMVLWLISAPNLSVIGESFERDDSQVYASIVNTCKIRRRNVYI